MSRRIMTVFVTSALAMCSLSGSASAQKVLVTYYSLTGHTKAMAEAIAKGGSWRPGRGSAPAAHRKSVEGRPLMGRCHYRGQPCVYMTNVAGPVLEAIYGWPHAGLKDKIGAAFVTGGEISGGQELTKIHLLATLLMEGMIVVGGPDWSQAFGASAITMEKPFADDQHKGFVAPMFLAKGEALGKRVAEITQQFVAGKHRK